jgi:hypothetical protein
MVRSRAVIVTLLLASAGGCRACSGGARRGRSTPICAVQDCATGKTIDDGCSDDGRCLSCINACPPAGTPSQPGWHSPATNP